MNVTEIISTCALVIGAVGLLLTLAQLRRNAKQTRAEWLARLYGRYLEDSEMAKIFYDIEYQRFQYKSNGSLHDSPEERSLDRLLSHYETIAMVRDLGAIKDSELVSFRYQLRTVYENPQVLAYLQFLDEWFKAKETPEAAFTRSRRLAKHVRSMSDRKT